jgi:hypothetical protein
MGLKTSPTSPCLFLCTLFDDEFPFYVSIYVDDIVYFSASNVVEEKFEALLSTIGTVSFMG